MELFIAHHNKANCMELVCYNTKLGVESARIYVDSKLLSTKLDEDEIDRLLRQKKEVFLRQKRSMNAIELRKEVVDELSVSYVLTRVVVRPGSNFEVDLRILSSDTIKVREEDPEAEGETDTFGCQNQLDILYESMPETITPIKIVYEDTASAADFQNVLCKLRREASQLTLETTYAEMAVTSIDKIKQVMSEKWQVELELKRSYSEPRRRWVSAINRVLIQNYIGKVKVRIAEVEKVQKEREEAFLEASPSLGIPSSKLTSPKSMDGRRNNRSRNTLDNSAMFRGGSEYSPNLLPSLSARETQSSPNAGHMGIEMEELSLPSIDEHSFKARRRRRQLMNYRKSFDLCHLSSSASSVMSLSTESTSPIAPPLSIEELIAAADRPSPSIRSSYSDRAMQALQCPVSSSVRLESIRLDPLRFVNSPSPRELY